MGPGPLSLAAVHTDTYTQTPPQAAMTSPVGLKHGFTLQALVAVRGRGVPRLSFPLCSGVWVREKSAKLSRDHGREPRTTDSQSLAVGSGQREGRLSWGQLCQGCPWGTHGFPVCGSRTERGPGPAPTTQWSFDSPSPGHSGPTGGVRPRPRSVLSTPTPSCQLLVRTQGPMPRPT